MTNEQIRSVLRETPFKPFVMFMADGRTFEVPHPEYVLPNPIGRTVTFVNPIDGSQSILDLFLMTEILTPDPDESNPFPFASPQPKNPKGPRMDDDPKPE